MRVLALLFFFLGHLVAAQTQLGGVKVNIEPEKNGFAITTLYAIDVPNDTEALNLKALSFGNASISQIEIEGFEFTTSKGFELTSIYIPFPIGQKTDKIILRYHVVAGVKGEIPIFFGDWQSASSDQDFFQLELNSVSGTNLLFPADSKMEISEGSRIIRAALPATTSMVRISQGSDSDSLWIRRVDQIVIVIFILIGTLIWFNRKRLIYG